MSIAHSRLFFVLVLMTNGMACTHSTKNAQFQNIPKTIVRKTASTLEQPPVELGEEWTGAEDAVSDQIVEITKGMLADRAKDSDFVRRDAHPKQHGCVQANFKIDASTLPRELQVGVFAPGFRQDNPAWIRFSNGSPDGATKPDIKADIRGMAIKLMNVAGTQSGSQDFVLITGKEFFSKNLNDYFSFHRALERGSLSSLLHFGGHLQELRRLLAAEVKLENPLQGRYFSSVPYKLGSRSMRFKATPCSNTGITDTLPDEKTAAADYLKDRLADTLKSKPACFEFWVQPNMDVDANPVENPVKEWDERVSPYYRVATVQIPLQDGVKSASQLNFCENLSFDPWHSLSDIRPLGQINRARMKIYSAISEFRHEQNHIPQIEPKSLVACNGESAPLCQTPRKN